MFFPINIADQVIIKSQLQAKWTSDHQRRLLAQFQLDMYNGLYFDYLNKKINDSTNEQGDRGELKKYIDTMNLTKSIINDISQMFAAPPEFILDDDPESDYSIKLNEILSEANCYVVLEEINKLTNLFFDMIAVPVTRNGKIEIDLITPDRCFITGNEFDPTSADMLFYQIGELPNDQKHKSRTDLYMMCSKDGKKLVEVARNGDKITDYYGDKYKDFIDDTQYPCNPAIVFRNYYPLSSFWHPGVNSLVEKDLNTDMRYTEYNMGRGYQLPLLVTSGLEKSDNINNSRSTRINFAPNMMNSSPDAKYITPDQKLDVLSELIEKEVERLKLSYKLSKSTISGQTATSGYELMLSKAEILNWNKGQQKYYIKPITDLVRCIIILAKKYGIANFKDDHKISIKFGEQKFIETAKEVIERQQKELLAGTKNLVDIELENNPNLDRETALKKVLDRTAENKQINNTAPEAVFDTAKPEI